jgi:hypothetical protein
MSDFSMAPHHLAMDAESSQFPPLDDDERALLSLNSTETEQMADSLNMSVQAATKIQSVFRVCLCCVFAYLPCSLCCPCWFVLSLSMYLCLSIYLSLSLCLVGMLLVMRCASLSLAFYGLVHISWLHDCAPLRRSTRSARMQQSPSSDDTDSGRIPLSPGSSTPAIQVQTASATMTHSLSLLLPPRRR